MLERIPCEPFTSHAELAACCALAATMTEEETLESRLASSAILANLSGWTVYGICEAVVRPEGSIDVPGTGGAYSVRRDGWGYRVGLPGVLLEWPVRSISEVVADGGVVDPATYAIMDDRWLVRLVDPVTNRNPGWPCHPRLDATDETSLCFFEITYRFGTDVPPYAKDANNELSCALLAGCGGLDSDGCPIPATATSISTQGMSLNLDTAADEVREVDEQRFPLVQRFIALTNPTRQPSMTAVWTPDIPGLHTFRSPTEVS